VGLVINLYHYHERALKAGPKINQKAQQFLVVIGRSLSRGKQSLMIFLMRLKPQNHSAIILLKQTPINQLDFHKYQHLR